MGDCQQNFELVLPKNVVEKCYHLKPGDGAKFLSTNFQKKIFSQLKLYKQDDESIRIGIEVNPLTTINKNQPEFICIEGATKDFLGTFVTPDEFIETKHYDKAVLGQLEDEDQEKSHQALIQAINKTLKSVDELDKLGESDSDPEETPGVLVERVEGIAKDGEEIVVGADATALVISRDVSGDVMDARLEAGGETSPRLVAGLKHTPPKLQTDIAVGKSPGGKEPSPSAAVHAIEPAPSTGVVKRPGLSAPIDTDITCEIILPKAEPPAKPAAKNARVAGEKDTEKGGAAPMKPVARGKRRLELEEAAGQGGPPEKRMVYKRERNVPCPLCGVLLKDHDSVYDHLKNSHRGDAGCEGAMCEVKARMRVRCEVCERELCNKDQLAVHMRQVHGGGPDARCPHCGATFRSMDYLKSHVKRIHLDKSCEKKFLCHLCPASFRCKSYLTNHVKLVHSENAKDSYRCELCGHCCSHEKYLKNHQARVHGDRLYACTYCERPFKTSANLQRHVRLLHEKQDDPKPFECQICSKHFSLKANMTEHVKSTHFVEHKFQCEACGGGFRRRKQLEAHRCAGRAVALGGEATTSVIMLPYGAGLGGGVAPGRVVITEHLPTEVEVETGGRERLVAGKEAGVEYQYIITTIPPDSGDLDT